MLLIAALTAVVVGTIALFTLGEVVAVLAFVAVLGLGVYGGWFAPASARRPVLMGLGALLVVGVGFAGFTTYRLTSAFAASDGAADKADAAALAAGKGKLDGAKEHAAFRLDLTDAELTAVVQDGLAEADSPVRSVSLRFVGAAGSEPGEMRFQAAFKNGAMTADGVLGYELDAGRVKARVRDLSLGGLTVPRAARAALEDIVEQITDLDKSLGERDVTVQALRIEDGRLVIIGTQRSGMLITSQALLGSVQAQSASVGAAAAAPAEKLGPGAVNGREAPGTPVYVALGDSLAANVGVTDARDGYVSRLHKQLQTRDGKQYGLRNFGISGETSGTMLRGQLDEAVTYIKANNVAYITVDIGANDLLAHLASDDCSQTTEVPACRARVDASIAAYEANLERILLRLWEAAPNAKVLFLQTYNPFSFGFASLRFEADTDRAASDMNARAATIAKRHNALVADGFAPFKGRAPTLTHMTAATPDIHPKAIGYDLLAQALLDAR